MGLGSECGRIPPRRTQFQFSALHTTANARAGEQSDEESESSLSSSVSGDDGEWWEDSNTESSISADESSECASDRNDGDEEGAPAAAAPAPAAAAAAAAAAAPPVAAAAAAPSPDDGNGPDEARSVGVSMGQGDDRAIRDDVVDDASCAESSSDATPRANNGASAGESEGGWKELATSTSDGEDAHVSRSKAVVDPTLGERGLASSTSDELVRRLLQDCDEVASAALHAAVRGMEAAMTGLADQVGGGSPENVDARRAGGPSMAARTDAGEPRDAATDEPRTAARARGVGSIVAVPSPRFSVANPTDGSGRTCESAQREDVGPAAARNSQDVDRQGRRELAERTGSSASPHTAGVSAGDEGKQGPKEKAAPPSDDGQPSGGRGGGMTKKSSKLVLSLDLRGGAAHSMARKRGARREVTDRDPSLSPPMARKHELDQPESSSSSSASNQTIKKAGERTGEGGDEPRARRSRSGTKKLRLTRTYTKPETVPNDLRFVDKGKLGGVMREKTTRRLGELMQGDDDYGATPADVVEDESDEDYADTDSDSSRTSTAARKSESPRSAATPDSGLVPAPGETVVDKGPVSLHMRKAGAGEMGRARTTKTLSLICAPAGHLAEQVHTGKLESAVEHERGLEIERAVAHAAVAEAIEACTEVEEVRLRVESRARDGEKNVAKSGRFASLRRMLRTTALLRRGEEGTAARESAMMSSVGSAKGEDQRQDELADIEQRAAEAKRVVEELRLVERQKQMLLDKFRQGKIVHYAVKKLKSRLRVHVRFCHEPERTVSIGINRKHVTVGEKQLVFDKVYGSSAPQSAIFADTKHLVRGVIDGYNGCIFAYGQTGAGKNHTMIGGKGPLAGVIPRTMTELSLSLDKAKQEGNSLSATLVCIEVYRESIRDLLRDDHAKGAGKVTVSWKRASESEEPDVHIHGARAIDLHRPIDGINAVARAASRRAMSSSHPSRSHLIVIVEIHMKAKDGSERRSKLMLCVLAGSERIDKKHHTQEQMDEAKSTNKSLSALGRVIRALARNERPSYREHVLTLLLRDSIGGRSKCILLACVAPSDSNKTETRSTLRFATSAKRVLQKMAKARLNQIKGSAIASKPSNFSLQTASSAAKANHKKVDQVRSPREVPRLRTTLKKGKSLGDLEAIQEGGT